MTRKRAHCIAAAPVLDDGYIEGMPRSPWVDVGIIVISVLRHERPKGAVIAFDVLLPKAVSNFPDGSHSLPAPRGIALGIGHGCPGRLGFPPNQGVVHQRKIKIGASTRTRDYRDGEVHVQVLAIDRVKTSLLEGTVGREAGHGLLRMGNGRNRKKNDPQG